MTIKSIFGIKDKEQVGFSSPERQSIEQTENYATKEVVHTKELYVSGNHDLTLQKVTDEGATTTNDININNGTVNLTLGMLTPTVAKIGTTTNHAIIFRANNSSYGTIGANGNWALGSSTYANSAQACIVSTTKGFLPPVMTSAQKNAISSPAEGLQVYDTDLHKMCVYTGAAWETITSA